MAGLFDVAELESELGKMADAVVQVYKTMEDFKKGLYPKIKYRSDKALYPIVVTLEDWFVYGDIIVNKLKEFVADKLKKLGLFDRFNHHKSVLCYFNRSIRNFYIYSKPTWH